MSVVGTPDGGVASSGGRFHRLYYGLTKFDFVRRRRTWFAISGIIILAGAVSLGVRGLNYDIEFVGGTSWTVPNSAGVSVTAAQSAVSGAGLTNATITTLGQGSHAQLQVEAKLSGGGKGAVGSKEEAAVTSALAKLAHISTNSVSVETVGPTWGSQVTHKAVEALIVFLVMIMIYISIFFEWKMALAAIIAVAHDILVTVGIYSLTFFLVTPDTVVAFLTVLGYSLYDTIVVFDRIRDNAKGLGATGKMTFSDVVNLSMNQTLARSINTSLVAILPILALLVLGAEILGATTLQYFGLALFIGLTSGAYSSIFIASPIVAMWKEHEPRYSEIARRLAARNQDVQLVTPAAFAAGLFDEREDKATSRRQKRGRAPQAPSGPIRPAASRGAAATGTAVLDDVGYDGGEDGSAGDDDVAAPIPAPRPAARSGTARSGAARSGTGQRQGNRPAGSASGNRPAPRPRKKKRR